MDKELLENQMYWTTDEIRNSELTFVFDERIPKRRYDEDTSRRFNEIEELQEQIEELKQAIKVITKYFS